MGERLHAGRVHRQHRIEKVGQANALRFGRQAEQGAVRFEIPGTALFDDLKPRLAVPIQQRIIDVARGRSIDERQRFRSVRLDVQRGNRFVRRDPVQDKPGPDIFQFHTDPFYPPGSSSTSFG